MYSSRPDPMIQGTRPTLVCTVFRTFILTHGIIGLIDRYRESDCEMHITSCQLVKIMCLKIQLCYLLCSMPFNLMIDIHYITVQPSIGLLILISNSKGHT